METEMRIIRDDLLILDYSIWCEKIKDGIFSDKDLFALEEELESLEPFGVTYVNTECLGFLSICSRHHSSILSGDGYKKNLEKLIDILNQALKSKQIEDEARMI